MKSCKDIAKIMSPGQNASLMDKIEIKLHLMICKLCRVYALQIQAVEKNFTNLMKKKANVSPTDVKKLEKKVLDKLKEKNS